MHYHPRYVINAAKEAKNPDPTSSQRLVYLSVNLKFIIADQ